MILALEAKDRYTAGHAQRVATFSEYVGEELRFSPRRMERLRYAALMHDIGKLIVPNQLLNKPGRLTEAEFERVKRHESVSVELLRRIDFLAPVAGDTTTEAATAAVDGTGLVEPAIIHVADAFDAMTSTRSYRTALSPGDGIRRAPRTARARSSTTACVDALIARDRAPRRAVRRRPRGRRPRLGGRAARGRDRLGGPRATSIAEEPGRGSGRQAWAAPPGRCPLAGGAVVALGTELSDPGTTWAALALIGGAIAAGELIELPTAPPGSRLPISFAFMVVLAEHASVEDAALVLLVALLASFLVRSEPTTVEGRLALFAGATRRRPGHRARVPRGMADAGHADRPGQRAVRARGRVDRADRRRRDRSHGA